MIPVSYRSNYQSRIVGWFLLSTTFLAPSIVDAAQNGLFRTPSIAQAADQSENISTDSDVALHSVSHRILDLQIKPKVEQDPIEAWLTQGEEIPATSDSDSNQIQDVEEIIPEIDDTRSSGSSNREVIIQRYADGKPQIEREVIQDENGNYLNDGYWRVFSQQGERVIIAQGQYQRGMMDGIWMRKHAKDSSGLFGTQPFTLFEGPFISIGTFKNNKLDGLWTLQDNSNQKIFEVPYRDGQRHGTASWWYPSQTKMREVTFVEGGIHGRLREWDEQKKLTRDEEYIEGQRVIRNVTYYRPQQLETENYFLEGKLEVDGQDDWWRAEPARLKSAGAQVQHGPVNFWYDNGLPKMKGNYEQGNRQGRFTWWHSNGNKQLEGAFLEGKKVGRWTWWHVNGMKASEGAYEDDLPVGNWTWWNDKGQVEDRKQLSEGERSEPNSEPNSILQPGGEANPEEMPDGLLTPPISTTEKTNSTSIPDSREVITLELDDLDALKPADGK